MAINNLNKNCRSAKTEIFRLESLAEYPVAGEAEYLKKWRLGEVDFGDNNEWKAWVELLKKAKKRGVASQRVKVVPKKLTDYIKFEISLWQKYYVSNGEKIFCIDENDYKRIITAAGFNAKDFCLFDDNNLLILNYAKTGKFSGDIPITNGMMVQRYSKLKHQLLEKAEPLESFAKNIA